MDVSCCESRISIPHAAGQNSSRASSKTSAGSAFNGKRRCAGSPTTSATIARLSSGLRALAFSILAFAAARKFRPRSPAPEGPLYRGTCRALSASERKSRISLGRPYALRLDVAAGLARTGPLTWQDLDRGVILAEPQLLGDVVLGRRDAPASYHLAVTLDDDLQGVNLVTRGEDLLATTHVHRLLQSLLDLATPVYRHHRLLTNDKGERLAKRDGAMTLAALRQAGHTPAEVRAMTGFVG